MGTLTVHILDEDQNSIFGANVYCNFPRSFLAVLPTKSECTTDDDGIAEFDDVPVGAVEIYVDGEMQMEIQMDSGEHKDVTITI